ncbi:MAG TPA: MobP2 family relaxase [Caproicibacter sp.]|nr:MobP2 family relaxase [Caproicibacter sp.]
MIFTSRYVFSEKKFSEYINYIDRPAAIRSQAYGLYSVYADYMDDPKKRSPGFNAESNCASALFTATKDKLTAEEKQRLKDQFIKAQKADSPMWQQVISFTNEFLEKNCLYERSSGLLDEDKIRTITRLAMQEEIKDEKMDGAAVWSASIHYNTDNIHVHIALVEPTPTRRRKEFEVKDKDGTTKKEVQFKGNMNKTTFCKVKSKIVNNIVDRSVELKKINEIIRDDIVAEKRSRLTYRDKDLHGAFLNLYRKLPADKRLWNYNMNALSSVRPQIDQFTKLYINLYHKKDYAELMKRLDQEQEYLKSIYGSGKEKLYLQYKITKTNDLYTRMGNAVLRELRDYDKAVKAEHVQLTKKSSARQKLLYRKHCVQSHTESIYNLKKALKKDYENAKNQMAFERLQQEIENEKEYER